MDTQFRRHSLKPICYTKLIHENLISWSSHTNNVLVVDSFCSEPGHRVNCSSFKFFLFWLALE